MLTLGSSILFSADAIAVPRKDTGFILTRLLFGTNIVGSFGGTNPPPYEVVVTNVPPGEYQLTVGNSLVDPYGVPIHVRVVNLGIHAPRVEGSSIGFDVVTAYPGKLTLVQSSRNLAQWSTIRTNVPETNSFHFTDLAPPASSGVFYRALVPP